MYTYYSWHLIGQFFSFSAKIINLASLVSYGSGRGKLKNNLKNRIKKQSSLDNCLQVWIDLILQI